MYKTKQVFLGEGQGNHYQLIVFGLGKLDYYVVEQISKNVEHRLYPPKDTKRMPLKIQRTMKIELARCRQNMRAKVR